MPLCNYFINGNCRFGSKCNNDHIDLKTLLRSEVEAVINGKQWVLSCFGPFKESAVLPNFINDQSFEEIRVGFIENSKNGNIQNYLNNLLSEYNSALQKLNELKMPSNDTIQLIASIYNNTSSDIKSQVVKPSITQQKPNPFQSANIFGAVQQQQQATMSSSSIFGSSTNSTNPFLQQPQQQQQTTSIFGSSATSPQTAATSPFSFATGAIQQQQQQPQSNIFTQNIFTTPNQPQAAATSMFSNGAQFGQSAAASQQSAFGSTMQQQQQPAQQQSPQSIFAQSSFSQPMNQPASSVFAAPQQVNPFQQVQPTTNIFGATQMSAPPTPETTPSSNIFAISSNNSSFQQQSSNPFQQQSSNPFQPQQQSIETNDASYYSQPGDLSAEENEAFKSDIFAYGKIPLNPPSKDLCI